MMRLEGWLKLLAAPLILGGVVIESLGSEGDSNFGVGSWIFTAGLGLVVIGFVTEFVNDWRARGKSDT